MGKLELIYGFFGFKKKKIKFSVPGVFLDLAFVVATENIVIKIYKDCSTAVNLNAILRCVSCPLFLAVSKEDVQNKNIEVVGSDS